MNRFKKIENLYPFKSNFINQPTSQDKVVKQHYLDEGSGPAVLLLHGNPTWSFYYRDLIKNLVDSGFRCIAVDHVGCGLSDKPLGYEYTLKRRIEDIDRLISHLNLESFNLVLHDWGGAVGFGVAEKHVSKIQKLVVLNSAAFRLDQIPFRISILRTPFIGQILVRVFNVFAWFALSMAVSKRLPKNVKKGYILPYNSWKNRVAIWNFVKDIPMDASHPSYKTLCELESNLKDLVNKKIGLFWGGKDFCFNQNFLDQWKKYFPDANEYFYPDSGHYVLEDAKPEINEDICNFLTSV